MNTKAPRSLCASFSAQHSHVLLLSLLTFALAVAFVLPANAAQRPATPPPAVVVENVQVLDVNPSQSFIARVEAMQAVSLMPRVEGELQHVAVADGSMVKAGETLFRIEQAKYAAQVRADEAKVSSAKANFEQAASYLLRLRATKKGGVSASDMDIATSTAASAKSNLQAAEAALVQSRLNLQYTTIKAPISGRIGKVQVTRGNIVNPATGEIARLVQLNPIRVVFHISETEFVRTSRLMATEQADGSVSSPMVAHLTLSDGSLYPITGKIDFVDNQINTETGTLAVRAVFENPKGVLIPGAYGSVAINEKVAFKRPVVAQTAVKEDRKGRFVLLLNEKNIVEQRYIVTGDALGTAFIVEDGLKGGETVIVQGVQKARVGQPVVPQLASPADKKEATQATQLAN